MRLKADATKSPRGGEKKERRAGLNPAPAFSTLNLFSLELMNLAFLS